MFFWGSVTFLMIQQMLAIWSLISLPFLTPAWTSGSSRFMYYWSLAWKILSITLLWSHGPQPCLTIKLCAMLCRATQDRWVMVESSDKRWSIGEGNVNHFSILALRAPYRLLFLTICPLCPNFSHHSQSLQHSHGQPLSTLVSFLDLPIARDHCHFTIQSSSMGPCILKVHAFFSLTHQHRISRSWQIFSTGCM